MKRTPVSFDPQAFPAEFYPYLKDAVLWDSSCSNDAGVWFVEKGEGYFLKRAAVGTLKREAELTAWFAARGLAPSVEGYVTGERDWLLTRRLSGEDCIHPDCLAQPERLCEVLAEALRTLHGTDPVGCPVPDLTGDLLARAEEGYRAGVFDPRHFSRIVPFTTPESAWKAVCDHGSRLRSDTLIHGDCCLPNILLDGWKLSGFVDVGGAGVGDRHSDLLWLLWSLSYNLNTQEYSARFLDAYGRQDVDMELLRAVAAMEAFL